MARATDHADALCRSRIASFHNLVRLDRLQASGYHSNPRHHSLQREDHRARCLQRWLRLDVDKVSSPRQPLASSSIADYLPLNLEQHEGQNLGSPLQRGPSQCGRARARRVPDSVS